MDASYNKFQLHCFLLRDTDNWALCIPAFLIPSLPIGVILGITFIK